MKKIKIYFYGVIFIFSSCNKGVIDFEDTFTFKINDTLKEVENKIIYKNPKNILYQAEKDLYNWELYYALGVFNPILYKIKESYTSDGIYFQYINYDFIYKDSSIELYKNNILHRIAYLNNNKNVYKIQIPNGQSAIYIYNNKQQLIKQIGPYSTTYKYYSTTMDSSIKYDDFGKDMRTYSYYNEDLFDNINPLFEKTEYLSSIDYENLVDMFRFLNIFGAPNNKLLKTEKQGANIIYYKYNLLNKTVNSKELYYNNIFWSKTTYTY